MTFLECFTVGSDVLKVVFEATFFDCFTAVLSGVLMVVFEPTFLIFFTAWRASWVCLS